MNKTLHQYIVEQSLGAHIIDATKMSRQELDTYLSGANANNSMITIVVLTTWGTHGKVKEYDPATGTGKIELLGVGAVKDFSVADISAIYVG